MKSRSTLIASALLLLSPFAHAGLFKITQRTYGNAPPSGQASIDAIFNGVETQVNSSLPNADASTYLKAIAKSGVISADGVGVDYVTQFSSIDLSLNFGLGADLGGASLGDVAGGKVKSSQITGFAGQYALTLGLRPKFLGKLFGGRLDPERFKVFANYMSNSFSKTGSAISFSSFGLNAQYKLIPGSSLPLGTIKWNGLDVTSGLRISSMNLLITQALNQSTTGTVAAPGSPSVTAAFNGTAKLGANTHIYSIPLEVSTSARLLYFLSPYVGLGTDFSAGSANSVATLNGPITVTDSSGSLGNVSGVGALDLGQNSSPNFTNFRYFVGIQAQVAVIAAFVQLNNSITDGTTGVAAGLRAYW